MIFWGDKPLCRIIIAFIIGIIIAKYAPLRDISIYVALSIVGLAFIYTTYLKGRNREYIAGGMLLLFIILLGYTRYISVHPSMQSYHYSHLLTSKDNYIVATIKSIPKKTSRYSCIIEVEALGPTQDSIQNAKGKMMAYFKISDSIVKNYKPGMEIILNGYVTELRKSRNPNAFDFNDYLKTKHIYHRVDIDTALHQLSGKSNENAITNLANNIREHSLNTFEKYFENSNHKSLMGAMVLGFRNTIDPKLYDSYTKTGAVHVLAVSGLHVGILCSLLLFLLEKLFRQNTNWNKVIKLSILTFACIVYVIITGASAAVMRASAMIIIYYVGKYWAERVNTYNVIAFSGFILLMYDPYMLFQASFQFSFLALLSIIYFYDYFYSMLYIENRILNYIWQLMALSLAAQILVSPLTIYYFHRFPTYFFLSGLVAVPAAYFILMGGLSLIILEYIFPYINRLSSLLLELILDLFIGAIRWIEKLPFSTFENIWIYKHELILLFLFIIPMMMAHSWRKANYIIIGLISLSIFISSRYYYSIKSAKQSSVTVYDTFNGYIIDFYDGNQCYSLASDHISDRSMEFITDNNRVKMKVGEAKMISLDTSFQNQSLIKNKNLIQMHNESILLLDSNFIEPSDPVDVDLAIIIGGLKTKMEIAFEKINAEQYIITQGVKYYNQNKWRKWCESNDTKCISIKDLGAYNYQLK